MPDKSTIHQNAPLTNISIQYRNPEYIAQLVSKELPVKHESDTYYVYEKESLLIPETLRANAAEAAEFDWKLSTASYRLEEHALKHLVTDRDRENADEAINLDVDTTEILTDKILIRREKSLIDILHTNGNWDNESSLAAAGAWSANTTVSNPILNVDSATTTIIKNSCKHPNMVVIDQTGFMACKEHQSIVDRVKYTSSDVVTAELLAKLFDVEQVAVSRAVYNSALEGLTVSLGYLMTDVAWVGYIEKSPALKKVSSLYTFTKGPAFAVKKWREEKRDGDFVEVGSMYQHVVPASACGYLIVNTVQ